MAESAGDLGNAQARGPHPAPRIMARGWEGRPDLRGDRAPPVRDVGSGYPTGPHSPWHSPSCLALAPPNGPAWGLPRTRPLPRLTVLGNQPRVLVVPGQRPPLKIYYRENLCLCRKIRKWRDVKPKSVSDYVRSHCAPLMFWCFLSLMYYTYVHA